ncbi:DUF3604 domain-containing protein [Halioglobus maricola]|uniref:DUF3604 domain-containing protein n=1 Tax=Halioglobus maricola TaxID=2601894 RepID=A0A5P9NIB9_9GAMM|nr:DUF3604 domain-containing protein [Halioglobus maricola]QFU75570.1 DUF3604 domain-containing protein [Halioglobus maricola]
MKAIRILLCSVISLLLAGPVLAQESRQLLFGDTHLHTSYSMDAYLNGNNTADPDTAYRYARGLPVIHPYHRARVRIQTPLDFLVVSDHAEMMGVLRAIHTDSAELEDMGWWGNTKRWFALKGMIWAVESGDGGAVLNSFLPGKIDLAGKDPVEHASITRGVASPFGDTAAMETTAWHAVIDAAEAHNEPGVFTAITGWEWSSIPGGANLHRIVFTPDDADIARQFLPYGSDVSEYPQDLWQWLEDTQAATGARFIAMPHNSNVSKGFMYDRKTLTQEPITREYAARRLRWEPISEITQIKGDSETHPTLSPNDEFAEYETFAYNLQSEYQAYEAREGDYMRSALKTGLVLESETGVNPYQFGIIGSTDSHSGLASAEEANFWGKFAQDSVPERKLVGDLVGSNGSNGWSMSAAGLAAVWADENTRDGIFDAFQRKEVYATTGTRLKVRMFAGWEFSEEDLQSEAFAERGYAGGVPMGGVLTGSDGAAPRFIIRAEKDPVGANLDRIQVVKGWLDAGGETHEQVYNVVWAGERVLGADGRLTAVGNTVDLSTGAYSNTIGAPALSAYWQDPDFDPGLSAFYYVRVLEIPTPRHSLLDSIALKAEHWDERDATIQERAYTSAVWIDPR